MGLTRRYSDPTTGASFGQAHWVVGEVQVDTARNGARITMATYVGVAEYSAGKQPIFQNAYDVTGSAYFSAFEVPLYATAQQFVAAQPEFSGAQVV